MHAALFQGSLPPRSSQQGQFLCKILSEKIHLFLGGTPAHSSISLKPPILSRSVDISIKITIAVMPKPMVQAVIIQSVFVMSF